MKLSVLRALPIVLAIDIVLFLVSGIGRFKNAHHGVDYWIGELVWLGFLVGAFALLILLAVAAFRRLGGGRTSPEGA